MRPLPTRPNLDQLRRQARDLLRAAKAGDSAATTSLLAAGDQLTLSVAQHALARDYGFPSWPRLRAHVEGARGSDAPVFVLRYVRSPEELRTLWNVVWAILGDPAARDRPHWHVFDDYEGRRRQMIVVEHQGRIIGGTIAMSLIAIEAWARGIGLGRRLLQTVEGETASVGKPVSTHANEDVIGFYRALGYAQRGKSKLHMVKGPPISPRLVEFRLRRWRERVGDLERGVSVSPDPMTGKIASMPW